MDYYESEAMRHVVAMVQALHPCVMQRTALHAGGVPGTAAGLYVRDDQVAWCAVERVPHAGERPRMLYRWGASADDMQATDSITAASSALVGLVRDHLGAHEPEHLRQVRALRGSASSLLDSIKHGEDEEDSIKAMGRVCRELADVCAFNAKKKGTR